MKIRIVIVFTVILPLILSVGCLENNKYPTSVVTNFMNACVGDKPGHIQACECAIKKIQEKMTLKEFNKAEIKILMSGKITDELIDIIADCNLEVTK